MGAPLFCQLGHSWLQTEGPVGHYCPTCGGEGAPSAIATLAVPPSATSAAIHAVPVAAPVPALVPYSILRFHARGGLGQVSVARDEMLRREVALKEIRPDRRGIPAHRLRFLREAEITGQLEHPGIIPLYQLGQNSEGEPYYTMRFVRGETLAEAIAAYHRKPTAVGFHKLLERFVDICQTMAYAHSKGVIHRDLKPANVLLGSFGETLVIDWGLARRLGVAVEDSIAQSGLSSSPFDETQAGSVVGTPAYMSPEQAAGQTETVGPPTDVYALGAILYEILTGRPAYVGKDGLEILSQIHAGPPPSALATKRGLPKSLVKICEKAMERHIDRRYTNAAELALDLERWFADEPVTAYVEPLHVRAGRWARRHRTVVAVTATVLLLLFVGLLGYRSIRARQVEEAQRREAAAERQSEELRREAESKRDEGIRAARDGHLDRAIVLLSEASGLAGKEEPLGDLAEEVRQVLEPLKRHQHFRESLASLPPSLAQHGFGGGKLDDALARQCEEALDLYGALQGEAWHKELAELPIPAAEKAATTKRIEELLMTMAIRLGLAAKRRAEDGRQAKRRALQVLDRLEAVQGPSHALWHLRKRFHLDLGNNAEADRADQGMDENPPRTALDYYLLGSVGLQLLRQPDKAQVFYEEALRLDPSHYGARLGQYLAAKELKDVQQQLIALTACLALRADPDRFHDRGIAYLADKKFDDAEADFTQALSRDPKHTSAYSWRALIRARSGRMRGALADLEALEKSQGELTSATAVRAAAVRCLAAAAARKEGKLRDANDLESQAFTWLGKAIDAGFNDRAFIENNADFAPLRSRTDYRELLRRLPP